MTVTFYNSVIRCIIKKTITGRIEGGQARGRWKIRVGKPQMTIPSPTVDLDVNDSSFGRRDAAIAKVYSYTLYQCHMLWNLA